MLPGTATRYLRIDDPGSWSVCGFCKKLEAPSEPGVQFSRDGLSSQLFPHRDWRADSRAADIVNSPRLAKKAFGHRV
jgi:hypothetical protein